MNTSASNPLIGDEREAARDDEISRIHAWWTTLTQPRYPDGSPRRVDTGSIARLRRARSMVEVLFEASAVELIRDVGRTNAPSHLEQIARMASLLAHVRFDDPGQRFAARLGGRQADERLLSAARFRRLLLADTLEDRATAVRRAIQMLDGRANVRDLARGWIRLSSESSRERTRAEWMIAYLGGIAPEAQPSPTGATPNARPDDVQ